MARRKSKKSKKGKKGKGKDKDKSPSSSEESTRADSSSNLSSPASEASSRSPRPTKPTLWSEYGSDSVLETAVGVKPMSRLGRGRQKYALRRERVYWAVVPLAISRQGRGRGGLTKWWW